MNSSLHKLTRSTFSQKLAETLTANAVRKTHRMTMHRTQLSFRLINWKKGTSHQLTRSKLFSTTQLIIWACLIARSWSGRTLRGLDSFLTRPFSHGTRSLTRKKSSKNARVQRKLTRVISYALLYSSAYRWPMKNHLQISRAFKPLWESSSATVRASTLKDFHTG